MMKKESRLVLFLFVSLFLAFPLSAQSWRFIIYGDTRTNDEAHRSVLQSITTNTPDYRFIINVGDVVNRGSVMEDWMIWKKAVDDVLGGIGEGNNPPRYMAAPGNHDQVPGVGETNWASYLPGQQRFGNDGRYFYFDYEDARFIVLNSEDSLTGPQLELLSEAIQNNPKQWLFTIWHRPIFDFGPKKYEGTIHAQWGVPLYDQGADIMFMGHSHYYVRSKKLKLNGEINPPVDDANGTAQIVTGNGGAPPYTIVPDKDNNAYMVERYTTSYGYTECTIDGDRMRLRHILSDGTVFDEVTYRPNPKPKRAKQELKQ